MSMNVWILTIGNSDVQLKSGYKKSLWNNHYVKFEKEYKHTFEPTKETPKSPATVPARVMGIVYGTNLDNQIFEELQFPLLDRFTEYLQGTNCPDKIIVILTDQENVFGKGDKNKKECPYWQDTRTLKPILEKYFEQDNKYPQLKTGEHIHYLPLEAEPEKEGLDDWNECLRLVDQLFQTEQITSINKDANIFVSHQAGTPAISSAVQFTSLAKFEKQVQFLVSNEYKDREAIPIPSSKYLRGIQIQKAKQLIVDGFPGAALKILEDITEIDTNTKLQLKRLVGVLNIEYNVSKRKDFNGRNQSKEFDADEAITRVIKALEIVEIFFEKQNYIQGITLLAAAHETFMKAAIVKKLHKDYKDNNIKWSEPGLGFVGNLDRKAKIEILRKLKFPVDNSRFNDNLNKEDINSINRVIGGNEAMFEWLCELYDPLFKSTSWKLLQYIGKYRRSYGTDRRNQLMHNLVGAKPKEVIKYLLGDQQDTSPYTDDNAGVVNAYKEQVKKPFLEQIKKLGLPYKESDLRKQLEEIASKLR